jgi:hypothetical protein
MKNAFRLSICVAVLGLLTGALPHKSMAAAPALTAEQKSIVATVDRLLAHPNQDSTAQDLSTVVTFADNSPTVSVALNPNFDPPSTIPYDRLCFGYYIAGAVKFRLLHPEAAKDMFADIIPGTRAAVIEYRAIRQHAPTYQNNHWSLMDQLDRKGQLAAWVAQTLHANSNKNIIEEKVPAQ